MQSTQHFFLPFSTFFSSFQRQKFHLSGIESFVDAFNLDLSNLLLSREDLTPNYKVFLASDDPQKRGLLKAWLQKGENADKEHFLLFPQCF